MKKTKPLISIFCGSRNGNNPELINIAYEFGATISTKFGLIYGGTNIGLMNAFANGVIDNDGDIYGIITEKFKSEGIMHNGVKKMIIATNMHDRKRKIYDLADVFVVFPGGLGTLDETFEILTWKHLNIFDKPILFFNYHGFFNGLFKLIEDIKKKEFIDFNTDKLYSTFDNFKDLIDMINSYKK